MAYFRKALWLRWSSFLALFLLCFYVILQVSHFKAAQTAADDSVHAPFFNSELKLPKYAVNSLEGGRASQHKENSTTVRFIKCVDSPDPYPKIGQRGSFWVLYNHVTATKNFACDESITYTTNADMTFLENLTPVVDRWRGPVSVAIYTPATDYGETMKRIKYMRECIPLIKDLVTFHLYFDSKYLPDGIQDTTLASAAINAEPSSNYCETSSDLLKFPSKFQTFRQAKGLLYPVNVARNLARDMATTHYVLASDIELIPTPDFIPQFFQMLQQEEIAREKGREKLRVFVLPVFEVDKSIAVADIPGSKTELLYLLKSGKAVHFHKFVCAECHQIPEQNKWITHPITPGIHSFFKGKRKKQQRNWEPFYVGTRDDPPWDERLSWEGRSNKMTQAYILCLLDYDFVILDNAFFVHSPGIKKPVHAVLRNPIVQQQDVLIKDTIKKELQTLYGKRDGCSLNNSQ